MGETTRHLAVRISEHIGISYRTLLLLTSPPFSAIREHIHTSNHNDCSITPEHFKIIAHGKSDLELLIKESLLIKHLQPNLNNVDSFSLAVF